jgi:hypothetical protein
MTILTSFFFHCLAKEIYIVMFSDPDFIAGVRTGVLTSHILAQTGALSGGTPALEPSVDWLNAKK